MGGRAERVVRDVSWDSGRNSEASDDLNGDFYEDNRTSGSLQQLRTVGDVHYVLHPLQETADRLGKQVEQFAEALDRLGAQKHRKRPRDCREIIPLILEYEKIADDTVKQLQEYHEPDRQGKLKRNFRRKVRNSSGRSSPSFLREHDNSGEGRNSTIEDLRYWEQERQTWQLFGHMLLIDYPVHAADPWWNEHSKRYDRPPQGIQVHHYSPENVVWQRFLSEHEDAWEKHVVIEWLKSSADSSGQSIEKVVEQHHSGADRGSGLWAHPWLISKEEIKGQKRLRSWPQPLDPDSPGIETSLVTADRTQGLVTQLDPDAFTRQGRSLIKEDISHEEETWLACWEMVRRGRSWNEICDWCQDRAEVWKALSLRGDPRQKIGNQGSASVSSLSLSRSLWRSMCAEASKNGGIGEYENAVYGVLSGQLSSVERVAKGWDDYLFAYYNSSLICQFEFYVQNTFSERLPEAFTQRHAISDVTVADGSMNLSGDQIVDKMQSVNITKTEAVQPMKMLQGSLISKRFGEFIYRQGLRLAQSANKEGISKIIKYDKTSDDLLPGVTSDIALDHYDMLRILTHMILIFQSLDPEIQTSYAVENIIVAYVDYLRKAGKQQLLPLYTSRLSVRRSWECMGRQLPFVQDTRERDTVMKLMKQYNMNVVGVLWTQLRMIIADYPKPSNSTDFPRLDLLDSSIGTTNKMPKVKPQFIGYEITGDQKDLISGFEWYMLLDEHWEDTMNAGTRVYKYLLYSNGLAAARQLSKTVTFSNISLRKTESILGRAIDISKELPESDDEFEDQIDLRRSTRSRSAQGRKRRSSTSRLRARTERELLYNHAKTFLDLENLMVCLNALEEWKDAEIYLQRETDKRHANQRKDRLTSCQHRVTAAIEPLLHGWLQSPADDAEAAEVQALRTAFLPEIALAYTSVLNHGGHYVSRNSLVTCMDLLAVIAAEGSDLADCFLAAGRMSELVDSMAIVSRSMLNAEQRGSKKVKRGKALKGENLGIWTVKSTSA